MAQLLTEDLERLAVRAFQLALCTGAPARAGETPAQAYAETKAAAEKAAK